MPPTVEAGPLAGRLWASRYSVANAGITRDNLLSCNFVTGLGRSHQVNLGRRPSAWPCAATRIDDSQAVRPLIAITSIVGVTGNPGQATTGIQGG